MIKLFNSGKIKNSVNLATPTKTKMFFERSSLWYNSTELLPNNQFATGGSFFDWIPVTISRSGVCVKLRVLINTITSGPFGMKMALFDSLGNLVPESSGSNTVSSADNGNYAEVTGLSAAITAGTYYIAVTADSSSGFSVKAVASSGSGDYASGSTYAGFPPSSLPAPTGNEGRIMIAGVYINF